MHRLRCDGSSEVTKPPTSALLLKPLRTPAQAQHASLSSHGRSISAQHACTTNWVVSMKRLAQSDKQLSSLEDRERPGALMLRSHSSCQEAASQGVLDN